MAIAMMTMMIAAGNSSASITEKVLPSHAANNSRYNPNHDYKRNKNGHTNSFNHQRSPFL